MTNHMLQGDDIEVIQHIPYFIIVSRDRFSWFEAFLTQFRALLEVSPSEENFLWSFHWEKQFM